MGASLKLTLETIGDQDMKLYSRKARVFEVAAQVLTMTVLILVGHLVTKVYYAEQLHETLAYVLVAAAVAIVFSVGSFQRVKDRYAESIGFYALRAAVYRHCDKVLHAEFRKRKLELQGAQKAERMGLLRQAILVDPLPLEAQEEA